MNSILIGAIALTIFIVAILAVMLAGCWGTADERHKYIAWPIEKESVHNQSIGFLALAAIAQLITVSLSILFGYLASL